jgi:hypothetical protein
MPRHVLIPCYARYEHTSGIKGYVTYYLVCYVMLQVQNMPYYMRLCTREGFQNRAFRDLAASGEGLRILKGPILKPFSSVKNWLNFFHLPFWYAFFWYFFFFALTLAVTFHYFLFVRTFFLLVDSTRCFLFFLYVRAFLLSTDCTRHRLFAFTQQGQGWNITIAIA